MWNNKHTKSPYPSIIKDSMCLSASSPVDLLILLINTEDPRGYSMGGYKMCVCVCVVLSFILDVRFVDVPAGVTHEEGPTGFLIHLPSAVLALIFLARRIQPFLSLVDREVELLCTNELILFHLLKEKSQFV